MSFATPKDRVYKLQLASPYVAGSGQMVLNAGQGAAFTTFPIYFAAITLQSYATGSAEVTASYTATGITTDTLTGVAVLGGSTDQNFGVGDYVEERAVAQYILDLNAAVTTLDNAFPISNANLQNSSITIANGSGISGGGTVALGGTLTLSATGSSGTVTSTSVVSANGLAGTVATATTTPAITLSTTVTGVLKGNGTAISAASAGTDYQAPITLTTTGTSGAATFTSNTLNIPNYATGGGSGTVTTVSVVTANGFTGTVANATTTPAITLTTNVTGVLKGNGTAISAATAGTDYVIPSVATLSSLASIGTITTGIWNGTAINAAHGGTGLATLTANAVMLGEGTGNVGFATIGTAGRILVDQGAAADPAFKAVSGDATLSSAGALTVGAGAITLAKQANFAASSLMGNPTGSPAAPSAITLGANLSFSGTTLVASGGGGSGTVTSVALALPTFITVSGSPVTTSGTLTGTLATQSANTIFAGPTTGAAAAPTFRAQVIADLPTSIPNANLANSSLTVTAGTGLSGGGSVALGSSTTLSLTAPVTVALGGTGDTSLTAYSVLCGGTTTTGNVQSVASLGTSGQVLTSNGAATLPTWQTASGSGTVTTVSVVTHNGVSGSVANATTTPAITLTLGDITPTQITQQAGAGINILSLNATTLPSPQTGTFLQGASPDGTPSRLEIDSFGASSYLSLIRSDGNLSGTISALTSGDEIGGANAWGYNGTGIVGPRAATRYFANENWSGTNQGTYVDIAATPNGSTTQGQIAQFNGSGGILIPGTVTGGDKGAGTINAAGYFVNGLPTPRILFACGACTAVTTTTATSLLGSPANTIGSLTFPANTFTYVGQKLEIEMAGICSSGAGTPTPQFSLFFGATQVAFMTFTGAMTTALTNKNFAITRCYLTATAIGGSGAFSIIGQILTYTTTSVTSGFFSPATAGGGTPVTIDTTASQAFDFKITTGVSTGVSFQILSLKLTTF